MASHHQNSADTGTDDPRVIAILRPPVDIIDLRVRQLAFERDAARRDRLSVIIEWFAIAAVIFASIYFAIQLVRGAA